jgi:hypothetical protein
MEGKGGKDVRRYFGVSVNDNKGIVSRIFVEQEAEQPVKSMTFASPNRVAPLEHVSPGASCNLGRSVGAVVGNDDDIIPERRVLDGMEAPDRLPDAGFLVVCRHDKSKSAVPACRVCFFLPAGKGRETKEKKITAGNSDCGEKNEIDGCYDGVGFHANPPSHYLLSRALPE